MSNQFDESRIKRASDGKFAEKPHESASADTVSDAPNGWVRSRDMDGVRGPSVNGQAEIGDIVHYGSLEPSDEGYYRVTGVRAEKIITGVDDQGVHWGDSPGRNVFDLEHLDSGRSVETDLRQPTWREAHPFERELRDEGYEFTSLAYAKEKLSRWRGANVTVVDCDGVESPGRVESVDDTGIEVRPGGRVNYTDYADGEFDVRINRDYQA